MQCALTLTQRLLLELLMAGHPVPQERLISHLYGSRRDGGPECAGVAMRVAIWRFRRRLAPYGIDLRTIGDNRRTEGWCSDLADNGREHIWLRDGLCFRQQGQQTVAHDDARERNGRALKLPRNSQET